MLLFPLDKANGQNRYKSSRGCPAHMKIEHWDIDVVEKFGVILDGVAT